MHRNQTKTTQSIAPTAGRRLKTRSLALWTEMTEASASHREIAGFRGHPPVSRYNGHRNSASQQFSGKFYGWPKNTKWTKSVSGRTKRSWDAIPQKGSHKFSSPRLPQRQSKSKSVTHAYRPHFSFPLLHYLGYLFLEAKLARWHVVNTLLQCLLNA